MNLGMEPPPYDPDLEHPPPEGWRRVRFKGGTLDGQERLVRATVSDGDDYNLILPRERYTWDGHMFVLAEILDWDALPAYRCTIDESAGLDDGQG